MIYGLYCATLAFTWFVILNVTLSVGVTIVADALIAATAGFRPQGRARLLLALRLLPSVGSLAFVAVLFVPSFLRFEPRNFDEAFGLSTTSLALIALLTITAALVRGTSALGEARRRTREWLDGADPIDLGLTPMTTFCARGPHAAMTLTGILTPTLIVTKPLLAILTREELAAAVAHEDGHLGSWDNLKRLMIRSAPDALSWFPAARRLEHEWSRAAECAADARAARDPGAGLALASALVKVARFMPATAPTLSSPLIGGEALTLRIEQLLSPAPASNRHARIVVWSLLMVVFCSGLAVYQPLLRGVHGVTEAAVHRLP